MIGEDEGPIASPCVSPAWDMALTCSCPLEAGSEAALAPARQGLDWRAQTVLDVKGDWAVKSPQTRPADGPSSIV